MIMHRLAALTIAAALTCTPVSAYDETPEDAYVACVIGKAVVRIHARMSVDDATADAVKACEHLSLAALADEQEAEGISDFIYMTLDKLAS
jgi:hypothetical protein